MGRATNETPSRPEENTRCSAHLLGCTAFGPRFIRTPGFLGLESGGGTAVGATMIARRFRLTTVCPVVIRQRPLTLVALNCTIEGWASVKRLLTSGTFQVSSSLHKPNQVI